MPQNSIYLLPPSEGKNAKPHPQPLSYQERGERLSFSFEKPRNIATHATQKDLKCQGKRYEEGIELNTSLCHSELVSESSHVIDSESSSEWQ